MAAPLRTWFEPVPTIVAESLAIADTIPRFLPPALGTPRQVAAALARAALPHESAVSAPEWLLPSQCRVHTRTIAALEERHPGLVELGLGAEREAHDALGR